jgi:hypothetical protein
MTTEIPRRGRLLASRSSLTPRFWSGPSADASLPSTACPFCVRRMRAPVRVSWARCYAVEGLYSSHLHDWRRQRDSGGLGGAFDFADIGAAIVLTIRRGVPHKVLASRVRNARRGSIGSRRSSGNLRWT